MKNFVILVIQLCGYAFILAFFVSLANYFFGWRLGIEGAEVPAEPEFAIVILILGIIASLLGWYLDKKTPVE